MIAIESYLILTRFDRDNKIARVSRAASARRSINRTVLLQLARLIVAIAVDSFNKSQSPIQTRAIALASHYSHKRL